MSAPQPPSLDARGKVVGADGRVLQHEEQKKALFQLRDHLWSRAKGAYPFGHQQRLEATTQLKKVLLKLREHLPPEDRERTLRAYILRKENEIKEEESLVEKALE